MAYKDKAKQRTYAREWMKKRRTSWFSVNGPCKRCGSWERLELDHIDRTTKVTHCVWSWAESRRLAELAKCQVLCRSCHLQKGREVGDRPPATTHGTRTMYIYHECRCDMCRGWNAARMRRIRAKHRK